jgi:DNA-binding response OmpR family regulator
MADILVVDDDKLVREAICMLVDQAGHRATPCSSGRAALLTCANKHYDIVLLDMLMPDMDGLETIRALRRAGVGAKIAAMSAGWHDSRIDLLDIARSLGADATIAKPFLGRELMALLGSLLNEVPAS